MITIPFQQQFTFRKLGYLYYTNSLDYRTVLEQNPQWTVTELPPLGATLTLPNVKNTTGGLVQSSFVFGLPQNTAADDIYPFNTQDDYAKALVKYTVAGVQNRVALNGLTLDSDQAVYGFQ